MHRRHCPSFLWADKVLVVLSIIANVCYAAAAAPNDTRVDYYDNVRTNRSLVLNTLAAPNDSSSNVLYVTDADQNEFRLVDISCFLPFSNGTDDRAFVREDVHNDAFAALLATWHFNNADQSLPLDVAKLIPQDCNVRLTTELFDTAFNPISSTRMFTQVLQRNHSLETPLPAAVVGAYRSATTSPLAILSGVNNITQVSYASTSADFDVSEQYPSFGRVCSSSAGDAHVAVDFFVQATNYSHVALLFVTDSYGSAFQKAFQDAATEQGLVTQSVALSFSADPDGTEIQTAVQSLKNTQIRVFFAIAFEDHYNPIMTAAIKAGIVGDDFLWIFPGFQLATFHRNAVFDPNSPLARATRGVGVVEFSGGAVEKPVLPNTNEGFPLQQEPESSFEKFRTLWRRSVQNPELVEYVQSRLPASLENVSGFDRKAIFSMEPGPFAPLIYDAILSLGKSMCESQQEFFSGEEVYQVFSTQDFEGASGSIRINSETGSRNFDTLTYTLWNVQDHDALDDEGRAMFKLVPTYSYSEQGWKRVERYPFVYADGTTTPPGGLPPVDMDTNLIGADAQVVGYTLMAIVMFGSVVSFLWMVYYNDMAVVRQSQPLFLTMVSLGTFVMASTIIPLSLEEPVENLDAACMASPWIYLSGAIVAFSALLAKTRGIYMAYKDPELDKILVTHFDFFVTFLALFGVNLVIMLTWTFVAPLEWDRVLIGSMDRFHRETESYGTCSNDNALPFVIVILVVNIGILVIANFQSYKSRNIETEYNESRYIGISMAAFLQAWCMGVPILIVVWDQPQAKFFVESGIIFVTALAILLLIYIPKMRALRKEFNDALMETKLQSFRQHRMRSKHASFDDSDTFAAAAAIVAAEERSKSIVAAHWGLSIKEPTHEITTPIGMSGEVKLAEEVDDHADDDDQEEKKMSSSEFELPISAGPNPQVDQEQVDRAQRCPQSTDDAIPDASHTMSIGGRASSSIKRSPDARAKSSSRRSFRFGFSGAVRSGTSVEQDGIRITHNPRSHRNLELANGSELSRAQLDVIGQLEDESSSQEQIPKIQEEDESSRIEIEKVAEGS